MDELELQKWLKQKIAELAKIPLVAIDINEPLGSFGLDSLAAVNLSSQIEDEFRLKLQPTLAWDYPTIALLSKFLADELKAIKKGDAA